MDELDELIEEFEWRASLAGELSNSAFAKEDFDSFERQDHNKTKWNRVAELLKELKEYRCKWIPVSERLPEEVGRYLITTKLEIHDLKPYYAVYTANFDGMYFDIGYIGEGISVIAWMPFPSQPYKEVNSDGNS